MRSDAGPPVRADGGATTDPAARRAVYETARTAVYTHGHHDTVLRSHTNRTIENSAVYLAPHLVDGAALLDVGAGPGTITLEFARRVGHVTVVEIDEAALSLSRDRASEAGAQNIDFVVADVHALPFQDDAFDVVHAHQVLQHVGDPVQALREMRRVVRPGGVVAARDADYAGFIWFPLIAEARGVAATVPRRRAGERGRTGCGATPARVGARGRVQQRHRNVDELVLCRRRQSLLVGRHVGRSHHGVRAGTAADQQRPGNTGRS